MQLSEWLASLGVMGDKLRVRLKPLEHHRTVGVIEWGPIMSIDARLSNSQYVIPIHDATGIMTLYFEEHFV